MAHRPCAQRPDRDADLLRTGVPGRRPCTSSTRAAGSWCRRSCTCPRASSWRPRWSVPCCPVPRRAQAGVERSFIPPGLTVGLSVVVSARGVASITLKGPDPGPLSRKTTRLMLAQLAWTLRQDPAITSFRGQHRRPPDHRRRRGRRRSAWPAAPSTATTRPMRTASQQIYALHHGRLVSGQVNSPTRNPGPFGTSRQGIGAFAVSLDDTQVAATTPTSLLVGPVLGDRSPAPVLTGSGLLRPGVGLRPAAVGRAEPAGRCPGPLRRPRPAPPAARCRG